MAICPNDVVNIHVPRRDDGDRLMDPPIIKLEFVKDTLDPQIIVERENIQLRMKKEGPILCERYLQFSFGVQNCRGDFCLYCKTGDKKTYGEYMKEANI